MEKLTQFDKQCFGEAIKAASEVQETGNYPVGAVLAIENEIIGIGGNEFNLEKAEKRSFVNHAENLLIIKHGHLLADAYKKNKTISLYSTLEPCMQCLGASVTNHINRILYIVSDPNGGACNMRHDNIGLFYKEFWPKIIHCPYTDEVRQMMIKYFHKEIEKGNTEWPERMLGFLNAS
jgi:tRNA(Arg) A34 adenosine deaminase TadA